MVTCCRIKRACSTSSIKYCLDTYRQRDIYRPCRARCSSTSDSWARSWNHLWLLSLTILKNIVTFSKKFTCIKISNVSQEHIYLFITKLSTNWWNRYSCVTLKLSDAICIHFVCRSYYHLVIIIGDYMFYRIVS